MSKPVIKYNAHIFIEVRNEESYKVADELFLRALLMREFSDDVILSPNMVFTRTTVYDGREDEVALSMDGGASWRTVG